MRLPTAALTALASVSSALHFKQPPNVHSRIKRWSSALDGDNYDIAVVGAGIGGLCAAAVLTQCYGKRVAVVEAHYLAGGCAHAFTRRAKSGDYYTFDSGPSIVLGCSAPPYNPLRQVLNAVGAGDAVEWIRYDGWGMVVPPNEAPAGPWKLELGPEHFQTGPLLLFGGADAVVEFEALREVTAPLVAGAVGIPAMAMRGGKLSLLPLLRHFDALKTLAAQGEVATGSVRQFLDGPIFEVKNQWLRCWLDALAFSLSGLCAAETSAAAIAYVLFDMHRDGAALDYPRGGMGAIVDALVQAIEEGGSTVALSTPVAHIDLKGQRAAGITLADGRTLQTPGGVVCNAPVWSLGKLLERQGAQLPAPVKSWIASTSRVAMTKSYMHLHLVGAQLHMAFDCTRLTSCFLLLCCRAGSKCNGP